MRHDVVYKQGSTRADKIINLEDASTSILYKISWKKTREHSRKQYLNAYVTIRFSVWNVSREIKVKMPPKWTISRHT